MKMMVIIQHFEKI